MLPTFLETAGTCRSETVIASEAKQSIGPHKERMDCLRRFAPRNDVAIVVDTTPRPRGAMRPSDARNAAPKRRGRRESRVRAAPAVSCAKLCEETHTSIQVQRRASGLPCAMVLRLMPRSPRRRIRLVTVIGGLKVLSRPVGLTKTSADLTPATGARTTRFCRTQPPVFAKRLRRALAPSSCVKNIAHGINPPCDCLARRRCRVHRIPSQRS